MSEKGQVIWGYCRTYYLKSTFECALHTHTHVSWAGPSHNNNNNRSKGYGSIKKRKTLSLFSYANAFLLLSSPCIFSMKLVQCTLDIMCLEQNQNV